MIKRIGNIALAIVCMYTFAGMTMHAQATEPKPLKVGVGQAYDTLNEAIASAQEGQVIQIVGSVTETNPTNPVLINKRLTIQGDGASVYTVRSWAKEVSPFQITAAGVTIQDIGIVINGGATTCSPIEIEGADLRLNRVSITLTGGTTTVFAPISVRASGLTMEEVTIPSTVRAPILMDLQGNGATFKKTSVTAGANTVGIYSATSPDGLVLDECTFNATANTATLVSIPTPDGLTLTGCAFSFTFSPMATGYGLHFTEPSAATATKTLTANGCVFYMNALGTGINLNGYNGIFTDCEFNYSKGGTAILSQSPSNADLTFTNCAFYMGKNSGEKPSSAKGLNLQYNQQGNITIDGCTLIASCNPGAAVATTASLSRIINSENGTLKSLTIHNSNITLNTGANTSMGVSANAELVTITKSTFKSNATNAKCVVLNGIVNGNISDCDFDIAQTGAMGLNFTDSNAVHLKNNRYNLSTSGNGATMKNTVSGTSGVVVEDSEINIQSHTFQGLIFENFHRLDIRNNMKINVLDSGKKAAITGIEANQIKNVEIDDLEIDLNVSAQGVAVNGTKFPQGEEGNVRVTNTVANLSGGASKSIVITYANGVVIDNYRGTCENDAENSMLLSFSSTVGVKINDCIFDLNKASVGVNVAAGTGSVIPIDENGVIKEHRSGNCEINNNVFHVGEMAKAIFFGGKNTHDIAIHDNKINANKAAGIVNIGYGRNQAVYDNVFESVDSTTAIISDGVDEIASFTMEVDDDIYVAGNIVDAYRNHIYNNKIKGSYERGFYISNNGDVVRDNDLSEATFRYESTPGTIINTQVIVTYCKDVKILNNRFTKARAPENQVVRINNAIISEMTGNTTQLVDGASEVLVAQGTKSLAPNGMKYPERIAVHDVTNTINGHTPVEIVKEWDNPDNLIYEYILRMPESSYTVEYYKDSVSDGSLLAVEQGVSSFWAGHVLTAAEVAKDLGEGWLYFHQPEEYTGGIASNIDHLMIKNNAAENVVIVVYLPAPVPIVPEEPRIPFVQPEVQRRAPDTEPTEIYTEIDEIPVPLSPPPQPNPKPNPNPSMGKSGILPLSGLGFIALIATLLSRKNPRI